MARARSGAKKATTKRKLTRKTSDDATGSVDELLGKATAKVVDADLLHPNPRNYKPMTKEEMAKEIASIKRYGLVVPIVVKERKEGGYWIVDGEHRWLAMGHLGEKRVHIMDIGAMADTDSDQLMIVLNELRGKPKYDALGALVASIAEEESFEDMVKVMPFPDAELRALAALGADPLAGYATNKDANDRRKNTPDSVEWDTLKIRASKGMRKVIEGACAVATADDAKIEAPPDVRLGVALEKVCAQYMMHEK